MKIINDIRMNKKNKLGTPKMIISTPTPSFCFTHLYEQLPMYKVREGLPAISINITSNHDFQDFLGAASSSVLSSSDSLKFLSGDIAATQLIPAHAHQVHRHCYHLVC